MTLRLLLDTGVMVAAQSPEERHHKAAGQLLRLGEAGSVELVRSVSHLYDLETAGADRRAEWDAWLAERRYISLVPGPMVWDVTRVGLGDVLVDDVFAGTYRQLAELLGTPPSDGPSEKWRRRQLDLHHVASAHLAGAHGIVTVDEDDLWKKRARVEAVCGLRVLLPAEAVAIVAGPS